jgi:hypothetical protein
MWVCAVLAGSQMLAQSGTVKSDGKPIPAAAVSARQGDKVLRTVTDQNGGFEFDGMTPGAWVVEADMFGFVPLRRDVQVAAATTKIDLVLVFDDRPPAPPQIPGRAPGLPGAVAGAVPGRAAAPGALPGKAAQRRRPPPAADNGDALLVTGR